MMQRDTQRGGRAFAWLAWALMATSTACGPSRSSDGDADTATDMDAGDEADAGMDPSDDADADVVDEEDGGDGSPTHEEVLAGLGVDTSPSGPTAPDGSPLGEDHHPLGRPHATLLPKMETFLAGWSHSGRQQYLIDDATQGWADLYSTIDDSWSSSPQKNVIGADMDGDGFDEIAVVFWASGDSSLRLLVIDRTDLSWVEYESTIATGITSRPSSGTYQPSLASGDLDGDGRDELVVGFSMLYVVEDMVEEFEVSVREYPGSNDLYVASGEIDGDGVDEMVVTYHHDGYAYCDIFDGDLDAPRLRANDLLHVEAHAHTYSDHVQVRMGDLDGDGLDEIFHFGNRRDSDHWNVTFRDDAKHDLAWIPTVFHAACDEYVVRAFTVLDWDGDGLEDEFFAGFALERIEADGSVADVYGPVRNGCDFAYATGFPANVWSGDVDGDGKDELLYYDDGSLHVDGLTMTGTYGSEWSSGGGHDSGSKICTANVDDDSPVLAWRGEHELLFTDPTPIAVLACPPYHTGVGQNVDGSGTTFGRSTASGVEEATSTGVSVGFSIGYEVEDPFGISSASFKITMEQAFDWRSSHSVEIEKSIAYTSGPGEDKVIFTAVPFDVYYYDVVSSPVPEEVGTVMSINVPRELQTLSVSREFYNEFNGDFPDIDETVLVHAIGDPDTYPTLADRDALLDEGGLYSISSPVGVGTGSITVTVSRTEGHGEGSAYDFSVVAEAEIGVGGVTFGTSAGFHYGWEHTVTNTEATFYEGSVGDIPMSSYTPDLAYTFGLFAHPFTLGDQTFTVVEYWVE